VEYTDIKKIINDMGNSNLDNLEIEFPDGLKIRMKKDDDNKKIKLNSIENQGMQNIKVETNKSTEEIVIENCKVIKSPMVGTFYASPSPTADPFVKVGDKVKKGQVVCIVEAMKLMNEIEAEFDGEIVEMCKKDEEMVEYGETLFKIK